MRISWGHDEICIKSAMVILMLTWCIFDNVCFSFRKNEDCFEFAVVILTLTCSSSTMCVFLKKWDPCIETLNSRNSGLIYGLVWMYDPIMDLFKASFDQGPPGGYSIGPKKCSKRIGFTASVRKSVQKALVLQYRSEKVLKKHWFYSIGLKKC